MITSKTTTHAALFGALLAVLGCHSELDGKAAAVVQDTPAAPAAAEAPATIARTLALDSDRSRIDFVGAKVTADHRGTFGHPVGHVALDADGDIVGMEVSVDTTGVDIEPEKLEQHLRSPDFFDVETYPTATFRLADVTAGSDGYRVTGDLQLHGVTKRITFPAHATISDGSVTADASFKIDRKDFGILYAGMADDLIKDEVLLEMKLEFRGEAQPRS